MKKACFVHKYMYIIHKNDSKTLLSSKKLIIFVFELYQLLLLSSEESEIVFVSTIFALLP